MKLRYIDKKTAEWLLTCEALKGFEISVINAGAGYTVEIKGEDAEQAATVALIECRISTANN